MDFYTDLRETWERLVEEVLLGKFVERFTAKCAGEDQTKDHQHRHSGVRDDVNYYRKHMLSQPALRPTRSRSSIKSV